MDRARKSRVSAGQALASYRRMCGGSRGLSRADDRESASAQVPTADTTQHRFDLDATTLRPGQFVYETTLERDASTTILGSRTVTVSRTTYNGVAAWLLLETRSATEFRDRFALCRRDALHPLHWSSTQGLARLGVEFRGRHGVWCDERARRAPSIVTVDSERNDRQRRDARDGAAPAALQTGWEDSIAALSITLGRTTVVPSRLAVIGEDRVRVPAGTFDCWVVGGHAERRRADCTG